MAPTGSEGDHGARKGARREVRRTSTAEHIWRWWVALGKQRERVLVLGAMIALGGGGGTAGARKRRWRALDQGTTCRA